MKEKKTLAISRNIARFPVVWTGGISDGGVVSFRTGRLRLVRLGDTVSQGTPSRSSLWIFRHGSKVWWVSQKTRKSWRRKGGGVGRGVKKSSK